MTKKLSISKEKYYLTINTEYENKTAFQWIKTFWKWNYSGQNLKDKKIFNASIIKIMYWENHLLLRTGQLILTQISLTYFQFCYSHLALNSLVQDLPWTDVSEMVKKLSSFMVSFTAKSIAAHHWILSWASLNPTTPSHPFSVRPFQ
jgi:hypothetical protein